MGWTSMPEENAGRLLYLVWRWLVAASTSSTGATEGRVETLARIETANIPSSAQTEWHRGR